ncbi:MAG: undecaprenyldiphospho-muramoylpentapeptide beta-N-acetylglucosaminyltransferase [Deltaproteobacteria bacterium]|nr:undecaprenyldiphospho-muramoylpentapeptide beta-N-acetylglucosaminyltransferase [Deltaproteobacteria bacterium]MBW2018544.1 undecaprenyldiphospho-muramoylpentapeptide beta-N-acetylglucosaminyltransferase [Deltaproteobacteria bacterium]MBW2073279.1 undecaprenyldiphospho-muramoylpentapeptide beta-N-acetylglucosaminyltransferase [Deltaproteobacteria bacterium]RLB83331.1 MAG: undecaprenyldiphospho-muramoylpentapeptide beta-N-acetylglucosaminyltransferase [Deltaproteobacteria bacterium]
MRVLIAGGGTGGHLFPGIALAEAFRNREPGVEIVFVGTRNPMEVSTLSKKGFDHVDIVAEGFKGRGFWRQVRSLFKIPMGVWQGLRIIWRFNPDIIIGVGGYASGPVALAARLMRKKIVIHEQNLLPGLTNRIVGRFADQIFISFPDNLGMFKPLKTLITGNPVRRELLTRKSDDRDSGRFTVLVLGGSQGAHAVNCAVVGALDCLKNPEKMAFVHQTGTKDAAWVAQAYETRGIKATVEPFFSDMGRAYSSADLVISRAGATTVSELMAQGKPAIFIPFPFAANNHQEMNARYVADAGGAEVILEKDLNGALLADRLDHYASHPEALHDMAVRTSALARPDAADVIVDQCRRLVVMSY